MYNLNPSIEDLPTNILFEILTRLPVKTIIHFKLVSKKWLVFISDSYFANLHLTVSPPGFMVLHYSHLEHDYAPIPKPAILRWVEINKNELDHHGLHHDPTTSLDLSVAPVFHNSRTYGLGSVNGLICLLDFGLRKQDKIYICNPITREYMILPTQQYYANGKDPVTICYGFGISSSKQEYKIVWIYQVDEVPHQQGVNLPVEAEVYTLGTGQWRRLGRVTYYTFGTSGPFLNNHVHWPISQDEDSLERIYTFDFDNETFQLFPSPPVDIEESMGLYENLGVLKGCLCHSYCSFNDVSVWVMKKYGVKNSWRKEVVIKKSISPNLYWSYETPLFPAGSLKDGSILMVYGLEKLLVYPDTNTIEETEFSDYFVDVMTYRPSFLKLHNFETERVHKF